MARPRRRMVVRSVCLDVRQLCPLSACALLRTFCLCMHSVVRHLGAFCGGGL